MTVDPELLELSISLAARQVVATQTARYVARCKGCGHKAAVDAELVTKAIQGREYTNPGIPLIPEDFVVTGPDGEPRTVEKACWSHLSIPDGRSHTRFHLDWDGVAKNALKRVGLWCACGNVDQLRVKPLTATRNDAKRCGSACHSAISSTCDCACGGKNHASAWIPQMANSYRRGA